MEPKDRANILIVDDLPENIWVLSEILKPFYNRSASLDGREALQLANSDPQPDLILLDIKMPGMDGYEVCRQLKSKKKTRDIPVIFVTGLQESGNEAQGFEAGAVDYITKPINPPVVLARVRTHLQLKEALRASEERRRFAQAAVGAFSFEWDARTNKSFWSEELFALFGLDPQRSEASLESWEQTIHPEDRERIVNSFRAAVRGKRPVGAEWRVGNPPADGRWLMAQAKPVFNQRGNLLGYTGVVMDISQRKQAEATLRQWADAFEYCAHGLAISQPGSEKILVCNPAYAKLLGLPPEMVAGLPILSIYEPGEHPHIQECIAKSDRLGQFSYETVMRRGDSLLIPVQVDLVSVRDQRDRVIYRVGSVQDITKRRHDQEALAWEASVQTATSELAQAIIGAENLVQVSRLVMDSALRLTGSQHGYVSYIEEESGTIMIPCWSDNLEEECTLPRLDPNFKSFMGITSTVLTDKTPLVSNNLSREPDAKGLPQGHIPIERLLSVPALMGQTLVGHISVCNAPLDYGERDLSTLQRIADIYAMAVSRIRVDERLQNVEVARRSAEEANRTKSEFLATVSHEIRTPLHNIMGTVQTMRRMLDRKKLTDEYRDGALDDILNSSRHLAGIIDDILEVSRIESGRIEVSLGRVELAEVADNLGSNLHGVARNKGLELTFDIPKDLPPLQADRKRLSQVIINLAGNAIKFTQQGWVRVSAGMEPDQPGLVRVDVADSGPGVPPERHEQIFERFERLDTSGAIPGTGLGLSICRKLVSMMGGRIWLDSQPGQGATFHFTVPVWEG